MKSEKLLRAIGRMRDDLVADAEITKTSNKHKTRRNEQAAASRNAVPAGRRALRLGIAVALIAALLGTTVLAARYWRFNGYHPHVGDSWEVVAPTDENGNRYWGSEYELSFFLPVNEDAPELIEAYYFPEVPEEYKHSFGFAYAGYDMDRLTIISFGWDVPDGEIHGIWFDQASVEYYGGNEIRTIKIGTSDTAPELKEVVLGGVEGVLIVEPENADRPHKHFYWSNGEYIFYMRFPIDFTEEQIGQIVGSVKKVEDIQPYLISMTEEQREGTFG